jgi:hypothetical protein
MAFFNSATSLDWPLQYTFLMPPSARGGVGAANVDVLGTSSIRTTIGGGLGTSMGGGSSTAVEGGPSKAKIIAKEKAGAVGTSSGGGIKTTIGGVLGGSMGGGSNTAEGGPSKAKNKDKDGMDFLEPSFPSVIAIGTNLIL